MREVTDGTFHAEVLSSPTPVVVYFSGTFCAPCKVFGPAVEKLIATEFSDRVKLVKMDVGDSPITPSRYDVRTVPTILFVRASQVRGQFVGTKPAQLREFLEKQLTG
jgi:thioredoxin 1